MAGEEVTLLPESMKERIKKLEKENVLLRTELETRFDKDKLIMNSRLQDAIREKALLAETNSQIQAQMQKMQTKINNTVYAEDNQAQRVQELQQEIADIMRERDEYFREKTRLEIGVGMLQRVVEADKEEQTVLMRNNQKLLGEKDELFQLFLKEKDKVQDMSRLESQLSLLQQEKALLEAECQRLQGEQRQKSVVGGMHEDLLQLNELTRQMNELRLTIKDKEFELKEREREWQYAAREKEAEVQKLQRENEKVHRERE